MITRITAVVVVAAACEMRGARQAATEWIASCSESQPDYA